VEEGNALHGDGSKSGVAEKGSAQVRHGKGREETIDSSHLALEKEFVWRYQEGRDFGKVTGVEEETPFLDKLHSGVTEDWKREVPI
jgi:hypothetical protein